MVKTYELTHISLAVQDVERSLRFYNGIFGVKVLWRGDGELQVQTPGSRDVIAFEEESEHVGKSGGVAHFGFRLVDPVDMDNAVKAVEQHGGKLLRRGEFEPGLPFAYITDPDGYEIEIWYEP